MFGMQWSDFARGLFQKTEIRFRKRWPVHERWSSTKTGAIHSMATKAWKVMESGHILPIDDLEPHFETPDCHCHPERHPETKDGLTVHNSFDRREYSEPDHVGKIQ